MPDRVLTFACLSTLNIGLWFNFVCLDFILKKSCIDPNFPHGYVMTLWPCHKTGTVYKEDLYLLSDWCFEVYFIILTPVHAGYPHIPPDLPLLFSWKYVYMQDREVLLDDICYIS